MKKFLAFTLVFAVLFSFAACGSKSDEGLGSGNDEATVTEHGFKDAADVQSFVDNFNSTSNGYAYMVESDVQITAGSLKEMGYSVYRILIWSDKDVANRKDALGDFEGKVADNNINVRLIYSPEGELVLLKTLFTVSNSSQVAKTDQSLSCDAMMQILAALFPKNTEAQTAELYQKLRLPTIEQINGFQSKSDYESFVDLIEDFYTQSGFSYDPDASDTLATVLDYNCGGSEYRLFSEPIGESQGNLYALYWDINFASFEDTLVYESAFSISA